MEAHGQHLRDPATTLTFGGCYVMDLPEGMLDADVKLYPIKAACCWPMSPDGHPDILRGNYWIQSPERVRAALRLFAIRVWAEERFSGMVTLHGDLFGTAMPTWSSTSPKCRGARYAWFEKPTD